MAGPFSPPPTRLNGTSIKKKSLFFKAASLLYPWIYVETRPIEMADYVKLFLIFPSELLFNMKKMGIMGGGRPYEKFIRHDSFVEIFFIKTGRGIENMQHW